jgi:hypothetical protein
MGLGITSKSLNFLYVDLMVLESILDTKIWKIITWSIPAIVFLTNYLAIEENEQLTKRHLGVDEVLDRVFWNHFLFQFANGFLMLSYVQINFFFLRLVLILASIFFILWGWFILDVALDL